MANLATSGVTLRKHWLEKNQGGRIVKCRALTLVLTAMGSAANKIQASVLGLTTIEQVSPFYSSADDLIIVATPNYAGDQILLKAAGTNAPADATGTFKCIVRGQ